MRRLDIKRDGGQKLNIWSRSKKGSATLEFLSILPLVVLMCLLIWQFVVAGVAVMDSQSLVSEAVRHVSTSKDKKEAKKRALKNFGDSSYYDIERFKVEIKGDQAVAKVETKIKLVFWSYPAISYKTMKAAPLIQ